MRYAAPWHVRAWVWFKTYWYVPVLLLLAIVGLLAGILTVGRWGAARNLLRVDEALRKRREKADAEIDELERRAEVEIQAIEERHAEAMVQLRERQAEEYETVRRKGPRAVAAWLNEFDRRMR